MSLAKIFHRFPAPGRLGRSYNFHYQNPGLPAITETIDTNSQGRGLGLSLSYVIAKDHRAELKLETKEDEGSIFIIPLSTA